MYIIFLRTQPPFREKHPLTGKLYCGGCGFSLNYKPIQGKNKYRRFECRKHALLQIQESCTYMNADLLEETVLFTLSSIKTVPIGVLELTFRSVAHPSFFMIL